MFRFVDPRALRTLALRCDMTAQVGRIAATGLAGRRGLCGSPMPGRWCTSPGTGSIPRRENLQLGAELIGADSVAAAAEIVALAIEALEAAGATGISVDFTLPDLVDTLADGPFPLDPAAREAVRRELDMKDAGALVAAGGAAYLPLIHAAGPFPEAAARLEALASSDVLASRIAALHAIAARVAGRARLTLDPSERHGFEYQSWFGFTLYADGVRGALGRGGTYRIGGIRRSGDRLFALSGRTGRSGESGGGYGAVSIPAAGARCGGGGGIAGRRLAHGGSAQRGG